jgi:hypothetical protein
VLYGQAGVQYVLVTATNLDFTTNWLPLTTISLTNSSQPFTLPKPADANRFYRVRMQ